MDQTYTGPTNPLPIVPQRLSLEERQVLALERIAKALEAMAPRPAQYVPTDLKFTNPPADQWHGGADWHER